MAKSASRLKALILGVRHPRATKTKEKANAKLNKPNLESLPPELLLMVVDYLPFVLVANLSMTCRTMRAALNWWVQVRADVLRFAVLRSVEWIIVHHCRSSTDTLLNRSFWPWELPRSHARNVIFRDCADCRKRHQALGSRLSSTMSHAPRLGPFQDSGIARLEHLPS